MSTAVQPASRDRPAQLPDGILVVVSAACPTCQMIEPVLARLRQERRDVTILSQDAGTLGTTDLAVDADLAVSYELDIEAVPTVVRLEGGEVVDRQVGWWREGWEDLTAVGQLGAELPDHRPGCGSRTQDPTVRPVLDNRFGSARLASRSHQLGSARDPIEACFELGWSDGLPVVPPTPSRVLQMLACSPYPADHIIGELPPATPCTVEKVAVNAVMAGCRPEYLPVVLAAVSAACEPTFNVHGVLCTLMSVGPVVVVDGPVRDHLGMNAGVNALGQGSRPNLTIGRALQLTIRNLTGARPGGIDRACFGNPGKLSLCFAEDDLPAGWAPLSATLGADPETSAVTLFAGEGPRVIADSHSRDAASLARSLAAGLRAVVHPKHALNWDALLVISPEHRRILVQDGWDRDRLVGELEALTTVPGAELLAGADGNAEGLPLADEGAPPVAWHPDLGLYPAVRPEWQVPRFRPGGLLVAHAGGEAGPVSAIIGGWVNGATGSIPVTKEIVS